VFQHYALFPHLTVGENVRFPLRMRRRSAGEIDAQVASALEMVQLAHLADRFPRELSGGQQQRVALARCFVYQPSIILMDEPLGALDKKLREHMQLEIRRLHRETGTTIVYVTHDQEEALALSDRICLMNNARVEQVGTPRDIYDHPRSTFAADFVGISNLFRGGLGVDAAGHRVLTGPEGTFRAPHGGDSEGDAAILVRPEMFEIGSAAANQVSGVVVDLVYAGAESRVLIRLKGGMVVTARVGKSSTLPSLGETLTVCWPTERAVLIR
jgi:putative spermidine/putrescine transport system ATP-binding protein